MPTYRTNLDVRDGDVEELVHLGVPHEPDVGDDGGPQITLKHITFFGLSFSGECDSLWEVRLHHLS